MNTMITTAKKLFIVFALIFVSGCEESPNLGPAPGPNPTQNADWLIPESLVFDGGPGKDGIPSIDDPQFSPVPDITFLADDDLVVLVEVNGDVRGYPHPVLDWHEIVNDSPGLLPLSVSYCPLTGTALGWERKIDGEETTFGVSGLLYNTNLMPYDRKTNSTWSQIRQDCVNGELISTKANQYPVTEIEWGLLKATMPDIMILNTDTGFSRNYGRYPYGDYKTNHDRLLFPVTEEDNSLPQKERVLGVIDGQSVKVYQYALFPGNGGMVEDTFKGKSVIIAGHESQNYIVIFEKPEGISLSFLENEFPNILVDDSGNKYNIFGASETTQQLKYSDSFIGFYFSFPAFFEEVDIYE